jgi:hypothetical protein
MPDLYNILSSNQISYKKHDHPAVFTCEEADEKCPDVPGARSKNLFLRNQKGNISLKKYQHFDQRGDLSAVGQESDIRSLRSLRLVERLFLATIFFVLRKTALEILGNHAWSCISFHVDCIADQMLNEKRKPRFMRGFLTERFSLLYHRSHRDPYKINIQNP